MRETMRMTMAVAAWSAVFVIEAGIVPCVDFDSALGSVRPLHQAGQPPMPMGEIGWGEKMFHYLPEAGIRYSRQVLLVACAVASLQMRADVKIGTSTRWVGFKDNPLYLEVRSPSACKVLVDGKLQGWMPGGSFGAGITSH